MSAFNKSNSVEAGFSLIEVLVAITILSIGLISTIHFITNSANTQIEIEKRSFALWSADNYLAEVRLLKKWPELGQTSFACHQGQYQFLCETRVNNTPNPSFRHIDIVVYESRDNVKFGPRLAGLVHIVPNESQKIF